MGIEWPDPACEDSPTGAHHFLVIIGNTWRCRYCWRAKWLPGHLGSAESFSLSIRKFGLEKAYQNQLRQSPKIRQLLEKLEKIRLLRKALPQDELMVAIAAILTGEEIGADEVLPKRKRGRPRKESG